MLNRQADRRLQIISAVASCASEEGMAAVTLRNIARRIGATTGMLTHYYENRTALLIDASTAADRTLLARVASHTEAQTGFGWLCVLFDESLEPSDPDALPWAFWLEYWASAERDPELGRHSRSRFEALRHELERCIQRCVQDGTFRHDLDVPVAAQAIVALMHGLGMELALRHAPLDACSRAAFYALLDGFRAR